MKYKPKLILYFDWHPNVTEQFILMVSILFVLISSVKLAHIVLSFLKTYNYSEYLEV